MKLVQASSITKLMSGSRTAYTPRETVEAVKNAGFDKIDISLYDYSSHGQEFITGTWQPVIEEFCQACADFALPVGQTHAFTPSGMQWDDPNYDWDHFYRVLPLNVRAAKLLGASCMVVHPLNLPREPIYAPDKCKEANLRYLAPIIESAKKEGVVLAVENMVDFKGFRRRYCGGDIRELIDLVDTIHDPDVVCCLDTGHANVSGMAAGAAARALGSRLKALHINDNRAIGLDEHLMPYEGTTDWNDLVQALYEIGYTGDFTFELCPKPIPRDAHAALLRYHAALGRAMLAKN